MAGSVAQVEGLLRRLGELEETVMLQQVSDDRLKEANIALMERLSEFQRVNESNVTQAEEELARIHCALQEERAARAAAEQAIAEQQTYTVQQRGAVASASETAQTEGARAAALSEQLRLLMVEQAFTARTAALGARALTRKYLRLLHERACRQRRLRGLQGSVLAGALLRKHCTGHLFGCDLSSSMIRIAESKGVYDAVPTCGDCVAYLRDQKASSADLIVAADVICYLHGLAELFSAAAAALASGGVFAFSTETCRLDEVRGGLPPQGPGWLERASERVAHCVEYVHYLVAQVRVSRSRIT
jgi:hypothetical protein